MFAANHSGLKSAFLLTLAIAFLIVLSRPVPIAGQCVPPDPDCTGLAEPSMAPPFDALAFDPLIHSRIRQATIGMDGCGRFLIAAEGRLVGYNNLSDVFAQRFDADTAEIAGVIFLNLGSPQPQAIRHERPSVAISPLGLVRLSWLAACDDCHPTIGDQVVSRDFSFDSPPLPVGVPPGTDAFQSADVSAGIADPVCANAVNAWERLPATQSGDGLFKQATADPNEVEIRDCDPYGGSPVYCFDQWDPCVAMRNDGFYLVCFADAEDPDAFDSFFNLSLRLYAPDGALVDSIEWPVATVNQPELESVPSDQLSPAVDFDSCGNITAVWAGPTPLESGLPLFRVFARRFHWAGPGNLIVPVSNQFSVINTEDTGAWPVSLSIIRPAVALSREAQNAGRFIVAWNAHYPGGTTLESEIHAQYFEADGTPMGREFRVNQSDAPTDPSGSLRFRWLSPSGRHTLAYGAQGQVVTTFTAGGPIDTSDDNEVYFTYLRPGYADELAAAAPACIKCDVNYDGFANGLDIQTFTDLVLPALVFGLNVVEVCPADNDCDGDLDLNDIPGFVQVLLGGPACQGFSTAGGNCGEPMQVGGADCNANGVYDPNDIADGTSEDCNENFIPDECDLDPGDPDGDGQTSGDLNENDVPDECEPDCNGNGVPDDKDIGDQTSNDLNANGIPDECEPDCNGNNIPDELDVDPADPDGNQAVSPDCNGNGVPDECEGDCNTNGVPDDCDIDPADPDGDEAVSPDCNANGIPDECDLSRPILRSLDCNDNGVPDECDLAECPPGETSCADCNANGFLDGCDIASGRSDDVDENGIPDECETQQMQGGGEGAEAMGGEGMPESPSGDEGDGQTPEALAAAWDEFYAWNAEQTWGPASGLTGAEQYELLVCKLEELGLPTENPWLIETP